MNASKEQRESFDICIEHREAKNKLNSCFAPVRTYNTHSYIHLSSSFDVIASYNSTYTIHIVHILQIPPMVQSSFRASVKVEKS